MTLLEIEKTPHIMKLKKIFIFLLLPAFCLGQSVKSYTKQTDKVIVTLEGGEMHISPLSDGAMRIQYGKDFSHVNQDELVFTSLVEVPKFKVSETDSELEVATSKMKVVLNKQTGGLVYKDASGKVFLTEKPGSRLFTPSTVQGQATHIVEQTFESPKDEYLYGTGQFQDGFLNIRTLPRRLTQVNTQISIPFIMSSKGYGLLWHNYGLTDFNPADEVIELKPAGTDGEVISVDVTTTEGTRRERRQDGLFTGTFTIKESGKYALLLDVGQKMARRWQVAVDGKNIIDFRNYWLPPTTSEFIELEAGTHKILVTGERNDKPVVYYKKVEDETVFRSPVANVLDYVVFAGNADAVISTYRNLTGQAPLMPIWSLGYIHCRERFNTQDELLKNAREFRDRKLPIDMIVQDWQYWGKYGWNAMKFDESNYPDPAKMVQELHDMDMRLMVSVWSKIDPVSELGKEFTEKGFYIPETQWVDFFDQKAADFYWQNFSNKLLKLGIDGWWQDATEPENDDLQGRMVNNGTMPGEVVRNVYPMYVTKTIYDGVRKDAPDERVFILTRSGFSGQQRYSTAVWSGDVGHDWETLKRQITGGLNMSITGMPWWTFDAGGFFRPGGGQYESAEYQERFLRWFQFATFAPLQRVHGYQTNTEFWRYGEKMEKEALNYLNLRYRLMPYIYSQAADITFNNGTIMRPLVMDFANDEVALKQNYEYMFGPSFLVAPVTEAGVSEWDVYLPKNTKWFDFWTGKQFDGGQTIKADAMSKIPLFVKAGSIIPMGDFMQSTEDKPSGVTEIRVYEGADGQFVLYEDEGTNYNYEKGAFSNITFSWDDKKQTLTIGKVEGTFEGMLKNRTFNIVWVTNNTGVGVDKTTSVKTVSYNGKKVVVKK
jgi:alpha-D-xyloside xylohydrolase